MKIRFQVYLNSKLSDYIKNLAYQEESTYSEMIAQIIREYKEGKENEQKRANKGNIRANGK